MDQPLSTEDKELFSDKKQLDGPAKMKYGRRDLIGTPTIGRSPNFVKTVGLGNLEVITVNGNTDV